MRFSLAVTVAALIATGQGHQNGCSRPTSPYSFRPIDNVSDVAETVEGFPLVYDFNTSNSRAANATNSWWVSAFLHGSDDHEYLVLSHITDVTVVSYYRGSIFDITDKTYVQFGNLSTAPTLYSNSHNGAFNVSIDNSFYFGATLPGNATKQLRTSSAVQGVQYDLTFDLSTPVLLNTGLGGYFEFGSYQTVEWSMPAGRTTGTLVRNGTTVTIDSDESFTWYDRQWNVQTGSSGSMPNWTWFELHLNQASQKREDRVSLWVYDDEKTGRRQWATVQPEGGLNVVSAVRSFESYGNTWTSSNTNNTYAQNWLVTLQDGTQLDISSVYADQEVGYPTTFVSYEGFVTVSGKSASGECVSGYGLVEVNPPSN
ncbi:hypothetical protein BO71DRAFT_113714 [Aspergillus ellipticus CBS 707.79]|uniref:AttH domain-containing protein n=1 Tax=Aspergillus ellipticus CBS 707.79 TaxID=1448320 RepID=A0A319EDL5_9EURO|nr:hypothetical protein BO71DRAFT_113714 [Aspergillus ellipticus CBS 707.79]